MFGPEHLQYATRLPDQFRQLRGLLDGVRHRFLQVHILAGPQRLAGDGVVQVIRHCHYHAVDLRLLQDLPVIAVSFGSHRLLLCILQPRFPDIAHCRNLEVVLLGFAPAIVANQALAPHSAADQRHVDAVVRAEYAPRRLRHQLLPGCQQRAGRAPEKCATTGLVHDAPVISERRTRRNTSSSIFSVSLPVEVFCWLGW